MPRFVTHQQVHRAIVRRSNPTRGEPGLLNSILGPDVVDPVANNVAEPVVNNVANPVVDPVVTSVVEPVVNPILKSVVDPIVAPLTQGGGSAPSPTVQLPPPSPTVQLPPPSPTVQLPPPSPTVQLPPPTPTVQLPPPLPPINIPPITTIPSGGSPGADSGGGAGNGGNGGSGGSSGNGNVNNGGANSGGANNGGANNGGADSGGTNSGGGSSGGTNSGGGSSGGTNSGEGNSGGANNGGGNNGNENSGGNENGSGGGGGSGNASGTGGVTGGDDGSGAGSGTEGDGGSGTGSGTGIGNVNNSGNGGAIGNADSGNLGITQTTGDTKGSIGSGQTPTGIDDSASLPSPGSSFFTSGEDVPVNAGVDPNSPVPDRSTNAHGDGSTGLIPGPSGIGTAGNGNGGSGFGGGSTDGAGATSGQKGRLSKGAVAGIIVGVLLVVAIVIILIIRRQRKHGNARRRQWWFSRKGTSSTYNDVTQRDIIVGQNGVRKSMRSSFETTVDRSRTPRLALNFEAPSLPPMAQLRGEPVLISVDASATGPEVTVTRHDSSTTHRRFSIGTATSSGSDTGQWLIINQKERPEGGQSSPMSVRLSSPFEAFAFPRPPTDWNASDYNSPAFMPPGAKSSIQDVPGLRVSSPSPNPFDDPDPLVARASAVRTQRVPRPIDVTAANPFVDPAEPNTPSTVHPEFKEVEIINRPFIPGLPDEMMVEVGDSVKILEMFDDGWTLVEKNPDLTGVASKPAQVGLIPIDCLRGAGLGVNEFITSKQVRSYSETAGLAY